MSTLSQFSSGASGVKSLQNGYSLFIPVNGGTGEDFRYTDITITEVNPSKCLVLPTAINGTFQNRSIRLINSTTLRISISATPGGFAPLYYRWQVIEFF